MDTTPPLTDPNGATLYILDKYYYAEMLLVRRVNLKDVRVSYLAGVWEGGEEP